MHVVVGVFAICVGAVLVLLRRRVGPPPHVGGPRPGTAGYAAWTRYNQVLGLVVATALIVVGVLAIAGVIS